MEYSGELNKDVLWKFSGLKNLTIKNCSIEMNQSKIEYIESIKCDSRDFEKLGEKTLKIDKFIVQGGTIDNDCLSNSVYCISFS